MCLVAGSLLDRGSLAIEPVRADVVRGPNGLYYAKYPLLCVVQCLPALLLRDAMQRVAPKDDALQTWALEIVPHALLATLALGIMLLAIELGATLHVAAILSLLTIFTTPLWVAGRDLYSETLQAVLIVYITRLAIRARQADRRAAFVWGGVLCGLALNAKILLVIMPIAILVDQCHERFTRERVAQLALAVPGIVAGIVSMLAYNRLRFGDMFAQGYDAHRDAALGFSVSMLSGLYGLLFSSGKSVFLYAPLLLASLVALPGWYRARRRDLCLLAIPSLFTFAVTARWWAWNGDWAWGPRLIVPVIPLLALLLSSWLERPSRARRVGIVILACAGLYVQLLGVAFESSKFLWVVHPFTEAVAGKHDPQLLRDDLLPVHFVPELNPIAGQQWLLTRYVTQASWDAQSDYPWKSLGIPSWRPNKNPTPERLNFWLERGSSGAAWLLQCALVVFALASGALLWRELSRAQRNQTSRAP
jgi:hypothetical protein